MAETIDYNTDLEQLLKTHAEECESLSILHRNSYEKYNGRSNYINIPVIILSSAIGFATGIDIGYANMNIILGVSSIFVGIIKSIDTYFQLGKRAESHRLCSLQFQQINKKIQIELALVRSQRVDAKDMMNIIKTDIKNLFDIAPLIDQDVIESFQKKYGHQVVGTPGKYTFDAHTPNLCNGLSVVTVNSARNKQDYEERSSRKSSRDGSPSRDNGGNTNGNGNDDGNGITVVIDDATITREMQKLQQLQMQDLNGFHASADIVTLQNKVPNIVPYSAHPSRVPSVQPSRVPSVQQSIVPSVQPSKAPSVQPSIVPSVQQSIVPSVQPSRVPSVQPSRVPSVQPSIVPSVQHSAPHSAQQSTTHSIHGGITPHDSNILTVQDVPDETLMLQLTEEQLQELLALQQQQDLMMQDLEGVEGEMM